MLLTDLVLLVVTLSAPQRLLICHGEFDQYHFHGEVFPVG